jgi:hypothetical protein
VEYQTRGKIEYAERRQQLIDFSGIHYKYGITPTDIEGFFEILNKVFVFIELKLTGTPEPKGQRLAFERVIDSLMYSAVYIVAEHNVYDTDEEVPAHLAIVKRYYTNREPYGWNEPKEKNLKSFIDKYLSHNQLAGYIV